MCFGAIFLIMGPKKTSNDSAEENRQLLHTSTEHVCVNVQTQTYRHTHTRKSECGTCITGPARKYSKPRTMLSTITENKAAIKRAHLQKLKQYQSSVPKHGRKLKSCH